MTFKGGLHLMRSLVRAVIVEDGKLLCLKLSDGVDKEKFYYMLPGGETLKIENIFDATIRHCLDKVNLNVKIHDLLFIRDYEIHHFDGYQLNQVREIEHIFLCHIIEKKDKRFDNNPNYNQIGVEWIPIKKLKEYTFHPQQLSELITSFCRGDDVHIYLKD